jgi:hypothetical protein
MLIIEQHCFIGSSIVVVLGCVTRISILPTNIQSSYQKQQQINNTNRIGMKFYHQQLID